MDDAEAIESLPSTSLSITTNQNKNLNSSTNEHQLTPTASENERRREECLMRILHNERRFEKLKPKSHKTKQELFEKFQEAILNRRCDIFQRRMQQLDAEFDGRRKSIQSNRKIRLEMMVRKQEGQRRILKDNFECDKMRVKRRIGDEIESKLRIMDEEEQRIEANLSEHFTKYSSANPNEGIASKIAKYQMEKPTTIKENGKAAKTKENGPGSARFPLSLWRDVPVVIAKLPDKFIQEDLELVLAVKRELS